jgi:hypothetical protein
MMQLDRVLVPAAGSSTVAEQFEISFCAPFLSNFSYSCGARMKTTTDPLLQLAVTSRTLLIARSRATIRFVQLQAEGVHDVPSGRAFRWLRC